MTQNIPLVLPKFTHRFFWNTDPAKLNLRRSIKFALEVLLERGDLKTYKWIASHIPQATIVSTVKTSRNLRRKTATFWAKYLGIPESEVECLKPAYRHGPNKVFYA